MVQGKDPHSPEYVCNTYSANNVGLILQIEIHCSLKEESRLESHSFVDHKI